MARAKSPPGTGPRAEYRRAYYAANREKIEAQKKAWRVAASANPHAVKVMREFDVSLETAIAMVKNGKL